MNGQTSWQGATTAWTTPSNWSNGVPENATPVSVYFTGTYNTHPALGGDRTVLDFVMNRAAALIPSFGSSNLNVTGNLSTVAGSGDVQFRGAGSLTVNGDFNINSIFQFGARANASTNSQFGNVTIGGATNVASALYFSNPGTVQLGDLKTYSGGSVFLTAGSGTNGTVSGTTNVISASSLSGTAGLIQAGKADTTGHLTVSGSTNGTFSGTIINGNGTVRLTKAGSGTLALTAVNTYTGTTAISGGTLLISGAGSINGTSGIALSGGQLVQNSSVALAAPITWTGGAVSGTGTISGDLLASGGGAKALNPGNSPGKLTVSGDVTLDSLTTVNIEINGTTPITLYDVLSVGDALALNNAALNVSLGYAAQLNDQFIIANFVSLSGTFNGLADGSTFVVGDRTLQIDYTSSDIRLLVTAVPEPQTAVLLAAGGVALLVFRRRSRLK